MLVLQILFGIFYLLAVCAAGAGAFGMGNLLLSESDFDIRWWAHIAVWLVSVVSLAVLIAIAVESGWLT